MDGMVRQSLNHARGSMQVLFDYRLAEQGLTTCFRNFLKATLILNHSRPVQDN